MPDHQHADCFPNGEYNSADDLGGLLLNMEAAISKHEYSASQLRAMIRSAAKYAKIKRKMHGLKPLQQPLTR